ncbi:2-amino-4-hydroxy-6-hydroxymethyldihydropteridine diphosphokinase [Pelagicoccus sp. SDUM812003]|uniref:2-amino-4-hydroxy-6- hydroxymethyldihydropteridine diphosphokinase n=1 Tax=Pelagicoccus sp. SDUM812003 TaxID=3041267 RepID=UPI00280DE38F|nr:2-amino-4-hydroxy-6-hydroxymethyldihydropteridine diphosphokinase [Pelagicoccus sp. SDUM812003]MDQ8201602.1 2-amino-4-hydroxy-6-hydroxymethyldihydropteridine diphosphokinase [Pelagicoccus sp. SDUM812003]
MIEAFLGLGSNLGDRFGNIRKAARLLEQDECIHDLELSPLYRTAPIGKTDQGWFINAVARVKTTRPPESLLELCLAVEKALKRERVERWGPRTLDIDILLYGAEEVDRKGLQIPHPRLGERAFALRPLTDLAPGAEVAGQPVASLLAKVEDQAVERVPQCVAVIGASPKEDRYANRAQRLLMESGYRVFPVSPTGAEILGVAGGRSLQECDEDVDTVTLYIGSGRVEGVVDEIVSRHPRRVIFNPGTENALAQKRLRAEGIEAQEACTLVLLRTGQF